MERNDLPSLISRGSCFGIFKQRKLRACSLHELCRQSSEPLTASLLILPNSLQSDAMRIQKYILKTIALVKLPDAPIICDVKYIERLVEICLTLNIALRDEAYCQLIRMSNCNESSRESIFALQILNCCLSMFPPSEILSPFLAAYLRKCSIQNTELGAGIGSRRFSYFAGVCSKRCWGTCSLVFALPCIPILKPRTHSLILG